MHAADQTGPGSSAGTGSGGSETVRYIITRPCLAEGSLRLLKYLQPLFPADGPVTLQDHRGELFGVLVDTAQGRLTGLGELYRAHNLGVNDVLLLSRDSRAEEEGRYRVECVVKPHARPQSASERPAPAPLVTEKRVVIHATPHVREVRTERVTSTAGQVSTPPRSAAAQTTAAQTPGSLKTDPARAEALRPETAAPEGRTGGPSSAASPAQKGVQDSKDTSASGGQSTVQPVRLPQKSQEGGPLRSAASLDAITARMQQHPAASARPIAPSLSTPIQMNFTPSPVTRPVPQVSPGQPLPVQAKAAQPRPVQARSVQPKPSPATPPEAAPVAVLDGAAPRNEPGTLTVSRTVQPHAQPHTPPSQNPEDQLAALARLTGYACEHLGDGVVRLRAELGAHGYSVLIATTKQALSTPAWRESCDYMALLTPEDERPQGIPRFTHSALSALVAHAEMTPLTPIDLRGYWNTGSFDQESAESIAELVSAHLAQRRSFSHVLETLAQQPAHSLVHLPRLAERLGSEVSTTELQSVLETLSRAPFLALTPLPNGQYYLRSEIDDLVQEFGAYAQSLQRRLRLLGLSAAQA